MKTKDLFHELFCLTEQSKLLDGEKLCKKWFKNADRRYIEHALYKFIEYNSDVFKFLGVTPKIEGLDKKVSLSFSTSKYIGSIPLRASDTGKQIGDLLVSPRYIAHNRFSEYIEIVDLLGESISPEIKHSLPLASGNTFRPPLYLEAVKFISSLEKLLQTHWLKFHTEEKLLNEPAGEVLWNKYIKNEYKVENRLRYPTRKNKLTNNHSEYSQIRYVFDLAKAEIMSSNTPLSIKSSFKSRLNLIERKLYNHIPHFTNEITIKYYDSHIVKTVKRLANNILNFNLKESVSWRVDFSDVFEKLIAYIFKQVAKETAGRTIENYQLSSKSNQYYSWDLKYLEPDIIYYKDEYQVFIDAKYKSNMYNKWSESINLKETYRNDLHQILSYSSFSCTQLKRGVLCFPSKEVEYKLIEYKNRINNSTNQVYVIGVPVLKNRIVEVVELIVNLFRSF